MSSDAGRAGMPVPCVARLESWTLGPCVAWVVSWAPRGPTVEVVGTARGTTKVGKAGGEEAI
jgi:hypothetical protein